MERSGLVEGLVGSAGTEGKYLKLGKRNAEAEVAAVAVEEGKEELETRTLLNGCSDVSYPDRQIHQGRTEATYIGVLAPPTHQLLQPPSQITPALTLTVLFNATRPIALSRADEELLCVSGHGPV